MGKIGMLTGHRPQKIKSNAHQRVKAWIRKMMIMLRDEHDVTDWIWGGALGTDQWGAEIAQDLGLGTHAYLAFPRMENSWKKEETRNHFLQLVANSTTSKTLSKSFSYLAYFVRDKAMIDDADIGLSVFNGSPGGTEITLKYNREVGHIPMYIFNPDNGEVELYAP